MLYVLYTLRMHENIIVKSGLTKNTFAGIIFRCINRLLSFTIFFNARDTYTRLTRECYIIQSGSFGATLL